MTPLRWALAALTLLLLPLAAAQHRLNVALPEDPGTLDPAAATVDSALIVTNQIYETLFRLTPEGEITGLLAADWSYATANRLRVRLVPGVTFSDGAPLDSAAVQASLTRLLDLEPGSGNPSLLEAVTAVEVQDESTVVIVTAEPYAPLTAHLAHPATAIVPGGHGRDLARLPVGSGPFELVEWQPSEHVLLRANAAYWGGAPTIAEVKFQVGLSPAELVERFRSRELHLAVRVPAAAYTELNAQAEPGSEMGSEADTEPEPELEPELITELVTGWSAVQLGINSTNPSLAELDVRQALALAIDKGSLVEAVPGGLAAPAVGVLPPTVRLAPISLDEPYPYEPAAARALLEGAGRLEQELTLDVVDDPELVAVAQALRTMLADVGIALEIRMLDAAQYRAQLQSPDLQLFLTRWSTPTFDPDETLFRAFHSSTIPSGNASRYRVAAVDALLREARNSTSQTVRAADYLDVLETVLTDLPVITLYYQQVAVAKSTALTGEEFGPAWYLLDLRTAALPE